MGEPVKGCGLAVRCPSFIISPGEGIVGSFSCKFINTVDRLRPACEDCLALTELLDEPKGWVSKIAEKISLLSKTRSLQDLRTTECNR